MIHVLVGSGQLFNLLDEVGELRLGLFALHESIEYQVGVHDIPNPINELALAQLQDIEIG